MNFQSFSYHNARNATLPNSMAILLGHQVFGIQGYGAFVN